MGAGMRLSRRAMLGGTAFAVALPVLGKAGLASSLPISTPVATGSPGVATVWGMSFWSNEVGAPPIAARPARGRRLELPAWHAEFA